MPGIHNDWTPVHYMIAELYQEEPTAKYTGPLIRHWDNTVRIFRFIEGRQLFEQSPTETDLKMHEALLHDLIGLGQFLEIRAQQTSEEELADFGIRRENLTAYIRELKDTFSMWHGPELDPEQKEKIDKAIF